MLIVKLCKKDNSVCYIAATTLFHSIWFGAKLCDIKRSEFGNIIKLIIATDRY